MMTTNVTTNDKYNTPYHREMFVRRAAMKINSVEELNERISERDMLRSTPYGEMTEEDKNQRFEDIRDLDVVIGDYEKILKEELQKKLDNPTVGMYANFHGWSDVNPYEIVEVRTANKIMVRAMNAEIDPEWNPEVILGGFSGHTVNNYSQKWIITSCEDAPLIAIRKNKRGEWKDASGRRFVISEHAVKFYDYNF